MDFLSKLEQIDSHFTDVDSAIKEYFTQILDGDFHNRPDLSDSSRDDISELRKTRLRDNELAVSLVMLAALESCFKEDFSAKKGETSRLGLEFQALEAASQKKRHRVSFSKILEAWSRTQPEAEETVRQIHAVFQYRNWLAHGRYGNFESEDQYDYDIVYKIVKGAATLLGPSERGTA